MTCDPLRPTAWDQSGNYYERTHIMTRTVTVLPNFNATMLMAVAMVGYTKGSPYRKGAT